MPSFIGLIAPFQSESALEAAELAQQMISNDVTDSGRLRFRVDVLQFRLSRDVR
jgi:hypothetical protein